MEALERNWWAVALRGVIAVLVGLGALLRPATSLLVIIALVGAWWFVDGVFAVVAAVYAAEERLHWGPLLIEGISGIILGLAVYFLPGMTTLILVLFVAAWFVITGALRIVAAVRLREQAPNEWLMVTSGAVSIVLGALIWLFPGRGALALVAAFGIFALITGVLLLALALRLRGMHEAGRAHPAT